jgi:uncharacterized linocin/CFP29 family protein
MTIKETDMDILKKEMAPITDEAWKEITDQTQSVLKNYLTARKFVDIEGPLGLKYGAVSTGRLTITGNKRKDGVNYGIREVKPLIEVRKLFEVDRWELDNINRGAKDIDLEPLEKAAKQVASFEENVIYKGLKTAGIMGLKERTQYPPVPLPLKPDNILRLIGEQVNRMQRSAVEGPYSFIINEKFWLELINLTEGYPIIRQLTDILGGQLVVNDHCEDSFLVSERGGDFELTLGQDLTVGYELHDSHKVKLFLTESFTFRVLSPEAVIVLLSNG